MNLSFSRFDLRGTGTARAGGEVASEIEAIAELKAMLRAQVPQLQGAIALVDSPRWPSDLDWSSRRVAAAPRKHHGREIDLGLRALALNLARLGGNPALAPLSMFPTPAMRYFGAHLNAASCKPHLRRLARALFGDALKCDFGPPMGGIFTRFMIAGFATYRALEGVAKVTYECYPDLQFRLWSQRPLPPKKSGRARALAARVCLLRTLERRVGTSGSVTIRRLDEADAAILVLSVFAARRGGATLIFDHPSEGRFMVALDAPDAERFRRYRELESNASPF